ncbi:cytidylate kinase [Lutibacter oricola]|uniref:Cytidylate kinase n=1 Tax=Lutibacter oricola TaxID=762486 RepID=A0A1H3ERT8_9FLAO|nr:(d)CMP kinase [Lutibacter oricola]SDX81466.1 cytidylate kinase [Lutibacter oricola]
MKKIIIAIDGFSSTGKSTLAKQIAQKLSYVYVDTGAMYRAVTLFAMRNKLISENKFEKEKLINSLNSIELSFKFNEKLGFGEAYLNGENVEKVIRSIEVSNFVSRIAEISEVRRKLVEQQQRMGLEKGIVMDGRDIGTVVFPNAALKLFMNASADTRAKRRFDELSKRGDKVSYQEILENVQLRDHIDSTRDDSPLVKAKDAIEIDNSNLTLEEQFKKVLEIVENKLKEA